ncbi:Fc.00g049950.m01.CDS01 [Cosmosporella sp. VM-42]
MCWIRMEGNSCPECQAWTELSRRVVPCGRATRQGERECATKTHNFHVVSTETHLCDQQQLTHRAEIIGGDSDEWVFVDGEWIVVDEPIVEATTSK